MWRLIKWLFFLAIIGAIILAITGKKIGGKTIEEHLEPILGNKVVKEGIRDVRSLVGEGLKAAGEAISEDVTDDERKQLDDMVKKELEGGKPIEMVPGQSALPPKMNSSEEHEKIQTGRPSFKEMEALPQTKTKDTEKTGIQEQGVGR